MIDGINEENNTTLSIGEIADGLGITRKTLSLLLNERQGLSIEMAVRLAEAFGTTAQFWINVQRNYGLWEVEKNIDRLKIRHFAKAV